MYELWKDPVGIFLIVYSVAALALIIERIVAWAQNRAKSRAAAARVLPLLAQPDRRELLALFSDPADSGVTMGHVTRTGDRTDEMTVNLSTEPDSGLTVPQAVTIPAGAASTHFVVTLSDEARRGGLNVAAIRADANPAGDVTVTLGAGAPWQAPLSEAMSYVLKHDITDSPETTLLLLDDALESVGSRYKKNLVLLAALAGTAPFLGLLGTVLGIINTFTAIMEKGFGGPTVISFGISRALWTTAYGLVIAVPAFIAYNLFNAAADKAVRELRTQANRIFVALGDL